MGTGRKINNSEEKKIMNEQIKITQEMIDAYAKAWETTPAGQPGDRTRAGLKAALKVQANTEAWEGLVPAESLQTQWQELTRAGGDLRRELFRTLEVPCRKLAQWLDGKIK